MHGNPNAVWWTFYAEILLMYFFMATYLLSWNAQQSGNTFALKLYCSWCQLDLNMIVKLEGLSLNSIYQEPGFFSIYSFSCWLSSKSPTPRGVLLPHPAYGHLKKFQKLNMHTHTLWTSLIECYSYTETRAQQADEDALLYIEISKM